MLNSTEHGISTVHKTKMLTKIKTVPAVKLSDVLIMLKNVKMPKFNDILTSIVYYEGERSGSVVECLTRDREATD